MKQNDSLSSMSTILSPSPIQNKSLGNNMQYDIELLTREHVLLSWDITDDGDGNIAFLLKMKGGGVVVYHLILEEYGFQLLFFTINNLVVY